MSSIKRGSMNRKKLRITALVGAPYSTNLPDSFLLMNCLFVSSAHFFICSSTQCICPWYIYFNQESLAMISDLALCQGVILVTNSTMFSWAIRWCPKVSVRISKGWAGLMSHETKVFKEWWRPEYLE